MQALQAAGAPYHRNMVPVSRAARAQIYPVSPTFAQLRTPILDGELSPLYLAASCSADKRLCGEFGGGWFTWVFREAAAANGQHASLDKAKAFYDRIAREVRQACTQGRLQCSDWPVGLVPQIRADDLDDIAASARRVFAAMSFHGNVPTEPAPSDLSAPDGDLMYAFLNRRDLRRRPSEAHPARLVPADRPAILRRRSLP